MLVTRTESSSCHSFDTFKEREYILYVCFWADADRGYSILYWRLKLQTIEVEWEISIALLIKYD